LPQEYRAHPLKTKKLKKEYMNALKKSRHRIVFFKSLILYIRIQLGI